MFVLMFAVSSVDPKPEEANKSLIAANNVSSHKDFDDFYILENIFLLATESGEIILNDYMFKCRLMLTLLALVLVITLLTLFINGFVVVCNAPR